MSRRILAYKQASAGLSVLPFAYYRFDGNGNDETGNYNSDASANMTYPTTDLPPFGAKSAFFDRSLNSYIRIPDNDIFRPKNDGTGFSWSFWTNRETYTSGLWYIMGKYGAGTNREFALYNNDSGGKIVATIYDDVNGGNVLSSITSLIPSNQWVHICYTYNGLLGSSINWKVYKNGSFVGSVTTTTITEVKNTTAPLYIGNRDGSSGRSYNGKMAGFGFYDVELTAAQVTELYNWQNSGNHVI